MILTGDNRRTWRKPHPSATLFTTDLSQIEPRAFFLFFSLPSFYGFRDKGKINRN
jgi:hypothetical protein